MGLSPEEPAAWMRRRLKKLFWKLVVFQNMRYKTDVNKNLENRYGRNSSY
jgi:hypothetical protein